MLHTYIRRFYVICIVGKFLETKHGRRIQTRRTRRTSWFRVQTLAERHMKDRGKGPPPPLSELNRRPSEQGIQITVQHLERHRTAGQDTLDLRNGASKFLIQSAIQTAPSYYLTRHEHDSVITCRTTGTPRAGMLSWSSGGQIKKKLCV